MYMRQVGVVSVFARSFNVLATGGGCLRFLFRPSFATVRL